MSEVRPTGPPRLRVVRSNESPPPRSRPGPAVLAVAVYAILFAVALGYLRARGPRPHVPENPPPRSGSPSATGGRRANDRAFLLSGAGLIGAARSRFDRRLNEERCDCGCGLTVHDCLARDQSCSRSPERAAAAADELR